MNKAANPLTPEQLRQKSEYMKAWYERNKERVKEKFKRNYHENPGKYMARSRRWTVANRDKVNPRNRGYQQKRYESMTSEQKQELLIRRKQYYQAYKLKPRPPLTPEQVEKQREYQREWRKKHLSRTRSERYEKLKRDYLTDRWHYHRAVLKEQQQTDPEQEKQHLEVLVQNYSLVPRLGNKRFKDTQL